MKRLVCIVLWTVCFAITTAGAWKMTMDWLFRSDIATGWTASTIDFIRWIAWCTLFAMSLLGVFLGLFGKLPGTKLGQDSTDANEQG